MRLIRPLTFSALAVASALVLAGCSSPGGSGTDGELSWEDSPLSKYLEPVNGGASFDEDAWAEQQKKSEELVAACMSDEGFEYKPVDQSQGVMMTSEDFEDQNTEEWVAANGWGMVQTQADIDKMQSESEGEEFVDPNQEYVESLSATEQEAYYATLYGVPPAEEELGEDGSYEYNWETAGCQGAAQHEVQGDTNYWEDEEFAPLVESMGAMWEELQKRPELVELDAKWADCMADAGYSELKKRNEASMAISDEMNALYEESQGEQIDDAVLKELKEREIDMALADFRCAKDIDYNNVQLTAQFAQEEQFIEDHKAELDALIAAYSTGKK